MHRCGRLFGTLLTLFLLSYGMSGQSNTTSLTGVVTDPSGAVLPGVTVIIDNPASGYHASELSGAKGEYSFDQVSPGSYQVKVRADGFAEQSGTTQLLVATPMKLTSR